MSSSASSRAATYVFVDESGNLDFGRKGTSYFVVSAIITQKPSRSAAVLQELRYELLAQGSDQLEFHATENSRGTRKRVSDAIQGIDCIRVHSIYGHKGPLRHDAPDPAEYFERFAEALGMWLTETLVTSSDRVLINFDSVLTKGQRGKLMQRLKARLNDTSQSYRISFMPVKSDFNGQIADYFAWSLFRQLERLDDLPLRALSGITQEVRELDEQSRISIEDQHRHPGEK